MSTPAQGAASFTFNETRDTLFVTAAFSGLSGPITAAHVHVGAPGVAGPVVTSLVPLLRGNRMQGFLTGADLDRSKVANYLRGNYYLNVHTAAHPAGEIRGQIELEQDLAYVAQLTGGQEVPAVSTTAGGLAVLNLSPDKSKLKFHLVVRGLSGPPTAAHFHQAPRGTNGPVVVDLAPFRTGNVISGELTPTPAFLAAFEAGNIYVNVHTAAHPGGEIRGQVTRDRGYMNADVRLSGGQMVPALGTAANGVAIVRGTYTLDTLYVFATYTGLSGPVTRAVLHNAPLGQATSAATEVTGDLAPLIQNELLGVQLVPPPAQATALMNALLRGNLALQLSTATNPGGEIRGQIYRYAREGYTFALNGAQERPNPVASGGYGAGLVSIDRDQSNVHYLLAWGGLSGPATAGHFHTGLSTQAGPVAFNLAPSFNNAGNPTAAHGYWRSDQTPPFTLRRALQFRTDSMYVNLHTAANPAGEIRGQVLRGARNLSLILAARPAAVVPGTLSAYPNPTREQLYLSFEGRTAASGHVRVTDALGRNVSSHPLRVQPGANALTLESRELAPGIYFLMLGVTGTNIVIKFAKE